MSTRAIDPEKLPSPLVERHRHGQGAVELGCRALDLVVATATLILLAPLLVVIAVAVKLESPGQALFRQRRLGRNRRPFTVNKFRTMRQGASHDAHREFVHSLIDGARPSAVEGKPRFKMASDDRITRVGRLLRRSSLDELPQLWNVIRGEMSLVGPRPPIDYEVERYPPHWFVRFEVKPGLTGLWQVSGRGNLTVEEMIALDTRYVRERSVRLNLWILLRTIPAVLSGTGAS